MINMGSGRSIGVSLVLFACMINHTTAQNAASDAYAARDICVGIAAKFANAAEGSLISYNAGKFKIEGNVGGQVTVFEGTSPIATIPNFTYDNYTSCIDSTLEAIRERETRAEQNTHRDEVRKKLAVFNTAFELNGAMNVGTCMQSAAMVGVYFGDLSQNNIANGKNIIPEENYKKFLQAFDRSLMNRLKGTIRDDAQFELEDDIKFFRYVPGRFVPYFPMEAIQRNNSTLKENLDDDYLALANLGETVGGLTKLYQNYATFLQVWKSAVQSDYQRSNAVGASLQCMGTPIRELSSQARVAIEELGLSIDLDVPTLDQLSQMTPDQLHSSDAFGRLVSNIRSAIRNM
jgi:hypothetical protein